MWFFNPEYVIFMWSKKAKYVVKTAEYVVPNKPKKSHIAKKKDGFIWPKRTKLLFHFLESIVNHDL